jgi:HEAT repeat protein
MLLALGAGGLLLAFLYMRSSASSAPVASPVANLPEAEVPVIPQPNQLAPQVQPALEPPPQGPWDRAAEDRFLSSPRAKATNLNEAIAGLRGNQLQQLYALEWLKKAKPDPQRRAQVAQKLEELLKGNDPLVRDDSARALVVWGTKEQVPALLDVLDHDSPFLRAAALEALGQIKDERAAKPVAERLADFSDRSHAGRALIAMGPLAEEAVRPFLQHKDAAVRTEATRILKRIGKPDPEQKLNEALGGLTDPNVNGRVKAANWLAHAEPVPARRSEVAKALEPLLTDPSPFPRSAAAKALVVWATAEQVPALIKALDQNDRATRLAAMEALGKLHDERAVDPIVRRLKDAFDRQDAGKALIALGPSVESKVLPHLQDAEWGVKEQVCKVLKEIGTKKSLSALQAAVRKAKKEMYGGYRNVATAAQEAIDAIKARS